MTKPQEFKKNDTIQNDNIQGELRGVPYSYITFRGNENNISYTYTDDATNLIAKAVQLAKEKGNPEITSFHIIQAAINETEDNLASVDEELINSGAVESVSALNTLINKCTDFNNLNL